MAFSTSIARPSLGGERRATLTAIDVVSVPTRARREREGRGGGRLGSILGNRVARVEDRRFLTVGGTYVEDLDVPGAAWLTYVRSPYAHARITAIDVSEV